MKFYYRFKIPTERVMRWLEKLKWRKRHVENDKPITDVPESTRSLKGK